MAFENKKIRILNFMFSPLLSGLSGFGEQKRKMMSQKITFLVCNITDLAVNKDVSEPKANSTACDLTS